MRISTQDEGNPENARALFALAGACAFVAVCGTVFDIVFGSMTSGDLTVLPRTALERFEEIGRNRFLGLYRLDLLNALMSLVTVPVFFALWLLRRRSALAGFALLLFGIGTALFVSANAAFPMLALSEKYSQALDAVEKSRYVAAAEALLARGEHGGYGAFLGFFVSTLASLCLSASLLSGSVIKKGFAYIGFAGHGLLAVYLASVTFFPSTKAFAMLIAAPGGIGALVWLAAVGLALLRRAGADSGRARTN